MHSPEKCCTFEQPSGIFFFECEELSGGLSELGEGELDSPYLSFIFESILANQLQLMVNSFLFERSPGCFEGSGI